MITKLFYSKIFAIILLTFLFIGCGAKKKITTESVDLKTKTELHTIETLIQKQTNTNVFTTLKNNENTSVFKTIINYKPIDNTLSSKVITPDGKVYELTNAEITEEIVNEKKQNQSVAAISKSNNFFEKKATKKTDLHKVEISITKKQSVLKKTRSNNWYWLIVVLMVVLVGYYLDIRFKWVSYVTRKIIKK